MILIAIGAVVLPGLCATSFVQIRYADIIQPDRRYISTIQKHTRGDIRINKAFAQLQSSVTSSKPSEVWPTLRIRQMPIHRNCVSHYPVKLRNASTANFLRDLPRPICRSRSVQPRQFAHRRQPLDGGVQVLKVEDARLCYVEVCPAERKSRTVAINGDDTLVAAATRWHVRVWRVVMRTHRGFCRHTDPHHPHRVCPLTNKVRWPRCFGWRARVGFTRHSPEVIVLSQQPSVAFSPDGSTIATGRGTLTLWTLADGSKNDVTSENPVSAVAFSAVWDFRCCA